MSNGDMIKTLFPDVEVKEKNNGYEVYFGTGTAVQFFNHQWWNAPYKEQQSQWIPVAERLPEPYDEVLVNIDYEGNFEGIDLAHYIPDGNGYIDGKWDTQIDWIEGPSEWYHVTAWMPLPGPYKESEGEK